MKKLKVLAVAAMAALIYALPLTANAAVQNMLLFYDGEMHTYSDCIYNLYVNGQEIHAAVEPILFNDHAVVPVREVFEACGAEVNYTGEKQCVEISYQGIYIRMYINDNTAYINGKRVLIPDGVVPKLINKPDGETKTMVPVRFISETAGMIIDFDETDDSIKIYSSNGVKRSVLAGRMPVVSVTEAPTAEPTPEPTPEPTAVPTPEPTPTPTAEPEITPEPHSIQSAPNSGQKDGVNIVSPTNKNITMRGIDISVYQGDVDWDEVEQNVDFVIIRCGYGSDIKSQDDKKWIRNVTECEKRGIPYGVYLYSYADCEEKSESEAQHVLRLLKGHSPSMPVFYDIEDPGTTKAVLDEDGGKAEVGKYAQIFCDTVSAAGYDVGIYSSTYWWTNYLTDSAFDNKSWYKWVAQYNKSCTCTYDGSYIMFQYSGSGSVEGIDGEVDMNYWYGDIIV